MNFNDVLETDQNRKKSDTSQEPMEIGFKVEEGARNYTKEQLLSEKTLYFPKNAKFVVNKYGKLSSSQSVALKEIPKHALYKGTSMWGSHVFELNPIQLEMFTKAEINDSPSQTSLLKTKEFKRDSRVILRKSDSFTDIEMVEYNKLDDDAIYVTKSGKRNIFRAP